jgi:hypothetical protein
MAQTLKLSLGRERSTGVLQSHLHSIYRKTVQTLKTRALRAHSVAPYVLDDPSYLYLSTGKPFRLSLVTNTKLATSV